MIPTEIWIHIFDSIDCLETLVECRSLSKQFYPICIQILYKRIIEKSPIVGLILSSAHCLTEAESYDLIPIPMKAPWIPQLGQEWPKLQFKQVKSAHQIGSKGLSQVIAECCVKLTKSESNESADLIKILDYLKTSCQAISHGMPSRTMSAYESIFRYI